VYPKIQTSQTCVSSSLDPADAKFQTTPMKIPDGANFGQIYCQIISPNILVVPA